VRLDQRADAADDRDVDEREERGDRGDDHGLAHDDVDLVEPVPEDGDADRDREEREQRDRHAFGRADPRCVDERDDHGDRVGDRHDPGRHREPSDLQPRRRVAPPVPNDEARGRAQDSHGDRDQEHEAQPEVGLQRRDAEGVLHARIAAVGQRPGRQQDRERRQDHPDRHGAREPTPPRRRQVTVGEQQQQEDAGEPDHRYPRPGREREGPLAEREADGDRMRPVLLEWQERRETGGEHDPTEPVAGSPDGDQQADDREEPERHREPGLADGARPPVARRTDRIEDLEHRREPEARDGQSEERDRHPAVTPRRRRCRLLGHRTGTLPMTAVPWPTAERISSEPSRAVRRSAIPCKPVP
jgi:hypothetical protein